VEKMIRFEDVDAISVSHFQFEDRDKPFSMISDRDELDWLVLCEQFMSRLRGSEKPRFSMGSDQGGFKKSDRNNIVSRAIMILRRTPNFEGEKFPYHKFSPSVDLFMRMVKRKYTGLGYIQIWGVGFHGYKTNPILDSVSSLIVDLWMGLRSEEYATRRQCSQLNAPL